MRDTFVSNLVKEAETNKNIILLTGDLGVNCLEPFALKYPDRYFNLGIAEQNMMSLASGLALQGKKVFIYSIGNFDTLRCLEQIRDDVCYMNLDVNIISIGAGLEYGQLGFTHHSTEDITCLRAMPNMTVFDTASISELNQAFSKMCKTSTPCYLRLNKMGVEIKKECPENLEPYKIKTGKDIAIFASGTIVKEAIEVANLLKKDGVDIAVYSCPMVKPINKESIIKELSKYTHVYTLEEQTVIGGFGSMIAEMVACETGKKPLLTILGIDDYFLDKVGDRAYLRNEYNLSAQKIYEQIKKNFKKKK